MLRLKIAVEGKRRNQKAYWRKTETRDNIDEYTAMITTLYGRIKQ